MLGFLATTAPHPSWNLIHDLHQLFAYSFMRHAFAAGTIVAVIAGVVGYFVVLRQSSFAAHALSEIGCAGASGGVAFGFSALGLSDHETLEREFIVYDALYAECQRQTKGRSPS